MLAVVMSSKNLCIAIFVEHVLIIDDSILFLLIMCLVDYLIKPGCTNCFYHSLDCFGHCFYLTPLWKRVIYKNFTLNFLLTGWLYLLQIWSIYNRDQLNIWYSFFFNRCVHICFLVVFDLTAQLVGSYFPDQGLNQRPWQWKHQVLMFKWCDFFFFS